MYRTVSIKLYPLCDLWWCGKVLLHWSRFISRSPTAPQKISGVNNWWPSDWHPFAPLTPAVVPLSQQHGYNLTSTIMEVVKTAISFILASHCSHDTAVTWGNHAILGDGFFWQSKEGSGGGTSIIVSFR